MLYIFCWELISAAFYCAGFYSAGNNVCGSRSIRKIRKKCSCYRVCVRVFVDVVWLLVCLFFFFCNKKKARTLATSKKVNGLLRFIPESVSLQGENSKIATDDCSTFFIDKLTLAFYSFSSNHTYLSSLRFLVI